MTTKKYCVVASPYARTYGDIDIPEEIINQGIDAIDSYVFEHFDDIEFGEPELDYCGIDYSIYDENDNPVIDEFNVLSVY